MNYNSLAYQNVSGDFSYGITSYNLTPLNNNIFASILDSYANLYEQYRVTKIIIRAQCGKGYDNDKRIKTILAARVDVDNQNTASTFTSFRALANASNSITRTLTEKGNVKICEYRPVMFDNYYTSNDTIPVLPNRLQWQRLLARNNHQWRGAIIGAAIPETDIQPNELKITLTQEVHIEFRGRIQSPETLSGDPSVQTLNPPTYDMTTTLDDLRNNLLTGVWFPIDIQHSIGNIGTSVTGPMLLGNKFRVQATQVLYVIEASDQDDIHCNIIE
jgi:hypothetical protein